jgi:hypothetical protein
MQIVTHIFATFVLIQPSDYQVEASLSPPSSLTITKTTVIATTVPTFGWAE